MNTRYIIVNDLFFRSCSPLSLLAIRNRDLRQSASWLIATICLITGSSQIHASEPAVEARKPSVATVKPTPAEQFKLWDRNQDGKLNLKEYLSGHISEKQAQARRDYKVSDFDGNDSLSLDEFKSIVGTVPSAERTMVPDPVIELATAAKKKIQTILKTADTSSDGVLSVEEWPLEAIKNELPALATLQFRVWDQDQNGLVTKIEAEQLLNIAYGITHIDGTPLRADNGWVVYRSYFKRTDKNEDLQLSKKEYLPSIHWPEEKVLAQFQELDVNKNENLSLTELKKSTTSYIDEFAYFLRSDTDLDGFLSKNEILKIGVNGATEQRLSHAIPAFDLDGDGKYSLNEFRLAPVGCSYVTLKVYGRIDADHDARLSWQEFYAEPSPQLIGLAWELFQRFDRNRNGYLERNEFEFKIDPTKLSPEKAFAACDQDSDQELNRAEYLLLVANVDPRQAERNFRVIDFDGNKKLSLSEFQTLPGLFTPASRGTVPDPVADLAKQAHETWAKIQISADENSDGQLTLKEWPLQALLEQFPPLADLKFDVWDSDQNGQVSAKEAEQIIDVAYGMKHINGAPLRDSRGRVLYRSYIIPTDKDNDQRLSKREYVPSIRLPEKHVLELFHGMDADQNGFLTFQEMTTSHNTNIDEFNYFLSRDRDLDGLLSAAELLKFNSNDSTPLRLPQGMAAFDTDGDGKFSLQEFRLAPVGISYVTMRVYGRKDLNHDAKLSWQEFYVEPSPQVIGLAWELFTRFDRNQNGQLDLNEFEFQLDPTKVPPSKLFVACDKNQDQELSLEEYLILGAILNPKEAKRNFRVVDFDGNGKMSLAEFQALPDLLSPLERGLIPDPIADLGSKAHRTWQTINKNADLNSDNQLSEKEWPLAELQQKLPPLAALKFKVWDADQNGQVDQKEAEFLIDVAFGIKHVTGFPLRSANGHVLYRYYFNLNDKDGDNRLSKQEYLPSINFPEEKVLALFKELDSDTDEFLSLKELARSSLFNIDEFRMFLRNDKDLDGFLSADELAGVNSNGKVKNRLVQGLAAFDTDSDGKLSLREFRLAPIGSSYVTLKLYGRKDLNHDAKLSWQEFYAEPSPQLIGLAWELFQRFDINRNGYLERNEFEFIIDPTNLSPQNAFVASDKNHDQELNLQEYLSLVANVDAKLAERNFRVIDYDGNKKLSLSEFQTLPGLFTPESRGKIPDPVSDLAKKAYKTWQSIQAVSDQNADGLISEKEWPEAELKKQWPPLADLNFNGWDTDQNGQISQQEAELLLDIAYGMKHVDGSDLRSENGWVIYRSYFTNIDKNRDHQLSKQEYLPSIRWPEEKVLALFRELDIDKNESLSIPELKKSTTSYIDELTFFLRSDTDLDGLLSLEELGKVNSNKDAPRRLRLGMAAFDTDGDGKFSLREFRLSPVGCFYVTLRLYGQKDLDYDGRLSWQEFYTEPAPQLMGLLWEMFREFDQNRSGYLELDEYEFAITPSKMSPEHAFTFTDKNGNQQLELEEYMSLVPGRSPKLAKRNFHFVDYDGNQKLSRNEFHTLPDLFPPEKRAPVPDPVADLAKQAHQIWEQIRIAGDKNSDGQLTNKEWPQEELEKQIPPLAKLAFSVWDQDQNGQISKQEAEQLIDVAYGMKQIEGSPLRTPNGQVLYRFYIMRTDKDGDHRLSKEEYLPSIRLPKEKVLELFTGMDADQDGFLTYQEMTTSSNTNIDEFTYFLNRDRDLDGLLSAEELINFNSNDTTPQRLPQGMAAFDQDGDGKFSLSEFRLAPVGISYVTLRVYDRKDSNNDARLSWEEFYAEPSPQLIGLAWELFSRFDQDQSGELELDEFEFRIDPSKLSSESYFAACDKDQSKSLSLSEYLSGVSQSALKEAERDFKLVDFDSDNQLSLQEYEALPDLLSPEKRGSIPDPVVELAESVRQTWEMIWQAADENIDDQLSRSEWPQTQLRQQLPPLAQVKFEIWDSDRNGQVDRSEVDYLIDIAYGIKHVTGAPLRTPNGLTLYRSYITHADKNADQRLSKDEYLSSIRMPEEKVLALFKELDADKDEFLSYQELAKSPLSNIDELKFFQRSDLDLDGLLSVEELAKVNSNDSTKERIPQGMAAFDSDQDGHFSLKEFRLAPMGCNYVTLRVYGRQDQDHDGQLSWNEFYNEPSPQLIGLSWELFKRYDRNKNGHLELNEIEFRYDPAKIPPEKYFAVADLNGDGKLTFEEVFTDSIPDKSDDVAYRRYQVRLARAEDKFIQDDQNQDQSLDMTEYIQSHQAAALIAERHRKAVGRTTADDGSKWLFPILGTLNVVLLVGVAIFFLHRKTS